MSLTAQVGILEKQLLNKSSILDLIVKHYEVIGDDGSQIYNILLSHNLLSKTSGYEYRIKETYSNDKQTHSYTTWKKYYIGSEIYPFLAVEVNKPQERTMLATMGSSVQLISCLEWRQVNKENIN